MTKEQEKVIKSLQEDLELAKKEDSVSIDVLTYNLETALSIIANQEQEIEIYQKEEEDIYKALNIENGVATAPTAEIIRTIKDFNIDLMKIIKRQEKEIETIEKENDSKQKAYDDCYCEYKHYKQFESIPKQKVKEILKKLNISDIEPWSFYKVSGEILFNLEELLEGEK